jgi:hypothetical protein
MNRGVAFALIACGDDENEGFRLGPGLEKLINQPSPDSEAEAAAKRVNCVPPSLACSSCKPVGTRDEHIKGIVGGWDVLW